MTLTAYKPSGVEPLEDVPTHWEVRRLKHWAHINDAVLPENTEPEFEFRYLEIGAVGTGAVVSEPITARFGSAPSRARRIVKTGDTIISTVRTYLKATWFVGEVKDDLICSTGFAVLTPRNDVWPKFLSYIAQSNPFTDRVTASSVGTAYPAIPESRLGSFLVPLPPLPEQHAIVSYLDYVDRRIRRYVSPKRKLIALLEEERQAVVNRAVTRGLDPNVRLKPSGVEWLGDVPEHWEVVQLGRIGVFSKGSGGTKDDEVADGIPCVRYGDLYTTHKYFIGKTRSYIPLEKAGAYTPINRGDVLFPTSGETIEDIGKSAVNLNNTPVVCGGDVIIFRPTVPIEPKFAGYALDCPAAQTQKSMMGRGITIMHIYSGQLKYLWFPLPPLDEQAAIVEYLDKATATTDANISRARRQIELVEEYRTRLIADVVTGKLDVREAAAQLPDEAEDDVPLGESGLHENGLSRGIYDAEEEPAIAEEVTT